VRCYGESCVSSGEIHRRESARKHGASSLCCMILEFAVMKPGGASGTRDRLISAWICRPDELATAALRTLDVEIHDSSPCSDDQWGAAVRGRQSSAQSARTLWGGESVRTQGCARQTERFRKSFRDSGALGEILGRALQCVVSVSAEYRF